MKQRTIFYCFALFLMIWGIALPSYARRSRVKETKPQETDNCGPCLLMDHMGLYEKALACFRDLAEKGDSLSQLNLGIYYHTGKGTAKDDVEAVKWYRMAAEQGDADAQDRLGHCYQKGTGVNEDPKLAFEWYMKAALQGYDKALYNVGICYMGGYGVEEDFEQGLVWMKKSAQTGYQPAISLLEFIDKNPERVKAWRERSKE